MMEKVGTNLPAGHRFKRWIESFAYLEESLKRKCALIDKIAEISCIQENSSQMSEIKKVFKRAIQMEYQLFDASL